MTSLTVRCLLLLKACDIGAIISKVLSDHKNLASFMSTKVLNCRQARWAELLANYDFVLVHTPGIKNPADGPLSPTRLYTRYFYAYWFSYSCSRFTPSSNDRLQFVSRPSPLCLQCPVCKPCRGRHRLDS